MHSWLSYTLVLVLDLTGPRQGYFSGATEVWCTRRLPYRPVMAFPTSIGVVIYICSIAFLRTEDTFSLTTRDC